MRIALLTTMRYDDPTVRTIVDGLCPAFRQAGHEVIAGGRRGPWFGRAGPAEQRTSWGRALRIGGCSPDPLERARLAREELRGLAPDRTFIMMVSRYDPILEEFHAAARGAPVLACFQDLMFPMPSRKTARLLDGFVTRCAAVTALSRAAGELVRRALPSARRRLRIIPNGCALAKDGRAATGPRPYALCASRQRVYKGIDVLLMAWSEVLSAGVDADLVLCGADNGERHYRRLAAALGIERRVRFLGEVGRARLDPLMRGCRLLVLPSRHEAFGMAALEAMALGRPVVATRSGGPQDFIADGENGLLVPPCDPGALARAIVRVFEDEDLSRRLGARAAEDARAYEWSGIAARYLALLQM